MKYNELIDFCLNTIKSWKPTIETLDSHADNVLKKVTDDNERVFIKQIFYGTHRYEQFLKVFCNALFKVNSSTTNRNDITLYNVFAYLIIFRLDELPLDEFKKMVLSQDAVKINVLLQFLFDVNLLKTHVRDEWCKIYDPTYIDDVIIGGIDNHFHVMTDLLATVSKKATGKVSDLVNSAGSGYIEDSNSKTKFQPTKSEPFNLSKSKVKALPQPILIPKIIKANPMPEKIFNVTVKEIEDEKIRRREEIKEKLKKAYEEAKKFDLETEKRPNNIDLLKQEAEEKFKIENIKKKYYKKPTFDLPPVDIKLNAAAILKEEAVNKKAKEEEEKYVKDIEMNMRDSKEFERWKKLQEEILKLDELEHKERKRVEMQLAREAAMKAVEEKTKMNKESVITMKEVSKENQKEREGKEQIEMEKKKELIQTVVEIKINAEIEKKKLVETHKKIHDDMEKEKKEIFDKKREEDLVEERKKKELIKKIRELEKIPIQRAKAFDPSETMGYGLLEECSLVELRERLEFQKRLIQEDTERKRTENVKKKEDKKNELNDKLSQIMEARNEKAKNYQDQKTEKMRAREEEKRKQQELREKSLLEVHTKIMKKKQDKADELDRIAFELREIQLKRQYMNADKAMVEAKAWKGLEDGAQREIKDRQNDKLMDQEKIERIKLSERKIIAERSKSVVEDKLEAMKEYDGIIEQGEKENEVLYREERENIIKKHNKIKNYEKLHEENMEKRDPYKVKISTMSLTNAKSKSKTTNDFGNGKRSAESLMNLPGSRYYDTNAIKEDVKGETME